MQVGILEHHSKNGLSQFMVVARVNSEWCEEKSCQWGFECSKMMFLQIPSQGTTPQNL